MVPNLADPVSAKSRVYRTKLHKAVGASGPPPAPNYEAEGEGNGWGFGGNLGLTWLPVEKQRMTFTYRSAVEVEYDGSYTSPLPNNGEFNTTIKYPNTFGLGYGIELNDTIQIEVLVEWLQWSNNKSQTLNAGGAEISADNNWDDTFTFGLGGSWAATDALAVRAGYAYLPSPIPDETTTPLLVDTDRHALSLGLGYTIGAHTIDAAYTFSIYSDRSTPSGTYDVDSNLFGLTYSASF